jgi:hypothetical protein
MPVGPTFEIIMFLDFVHHLMFLEKTWKLDLSPSSGKIMAASTLLGPLKEASLNHWMMDKVQKHDSLNDVQYTIVRTL